MTIENRSGDHTLDRSHDYYSQNWEEIIDKKFSQTVFLPYPALVNKELVNGHRNWKPYLGGEFDKEKYDLVENMWDHEHCSICNFKITEGKTYWFNKGRIRFLCDECYLYFENES